MDGPPDDRLSSGVMGKREPRPTAFVILEYCGGALTDALHRQLSAWNPDEKILVLDNASPSNRAASITHRNRRNSYVGGGIRDCLKLAEKVGARYLFYCVNDVEFDGELHVADFQKAMDDDDDVVMHSCALTEDSHQAGGFPWMVRRALAGMRRVRFADPICCLIRLDFVRSFGGFPPSKGGWGYSSEAAYHARTQDKKIYVNDGCAVRHLAARQSIMTPGGKVASKRQEAETVYARRYGDISVIRKSLEPPDFDEEDVVGAKSAATRDLKPERGKKD